MKAAPLVFYIARVLPSYRVAVLRRLNERLEGHLVVGTGQPPEGSSLKALSPETAYPFCHVALRNYWIAGERIHMQPFGKPFRQYGRADVILAEESPRSLTLPWLLWYARRQGMGTALWGHFSANERPFRPDMHRADRYRLWLARQADACVCYTDSIADLLRPHLPDERLFVARNTLDTDVLFAQYDALAAEGKAAVRHRLGLPAGLPIIAFIGRLIPEKGIDLLLNVFARLRADTPAALLIIGDGPERTAMETRVAREALDHVYFIGALPAAAAGPYLYASDVMLIPGQLGLAVNHAFAFGLPVVSQAASPGIRYHGPEAAFITHKENGMLAERGNPEALLAAVRHVLADPAHFAHNALTYARTHLTLNQMVDGLEAAIRFADKARDRPSYR